MCKANRSCCHAVYHAVCTVLPCSMRTACSMIIVTLLYNEEATRHYCTVYCIRSLLYTKDLLNAVRIGTVEATMNAVRYWHCGRLATVEDLRRRWMQCVLTLWSSRRRPCEDGECSAYWHCEACGAAEALRRQWTQCVLTLWSLRWRPCEDGATSWRRLL